MLRITLFLTTLLIQTVSIYSKPIILGQSCVLMGPSKELGIGAKLGIHAYFKNIPEITVTTVDDKYEPSLCYQNTSDLIAQDVTALIGYVGTPTSKVAVPLAMKKQKIFFGPFSGADFLDDVTQNPYCFRLRTSYDVELDFIIKHLIDDCGTKKIALFLQDDAFGDMGKKGVYSAIEKYSASGISVVSVGQYKRNTLAVTAGADTVMKSGAEAVILIGSYLPCGTAINYWKSKGFDVPFINISFVGSKALRDVVKQNPKNVFITQVVPSPWDTSIPIVAEYTKNISKVDIDFVTLEGYITAKVMHEALKIAGTDLSSNAIKIALESMNAYNIGGLTVSFSPTDHNGLDFVSLTKINPDQTFSVISSLKE